MEDWYHGQELVKTCPPYVGLDDTENYETLGGFQDTNEESKDDCD